MPYTYMPPMCLFKAPSLHTRLGSPADTCLPSPLVSHLLPTTPSASPATLQLDAAGYRALVAEVKSACDAGALSPPTLCRLGFHSVHIASSVAKGWGANGGFHAWAVDYDHPSNGGLGDNIKFLLQVRVSSSHQG